MNLLNATLYNKLQQIKYLSRTGIFVDIENLGQNKKCLAIPEVDSLEEIRPGVWLSKTSKSFSKNNFTNIYDLYWNPNQIDIVPQIYSSNTSYSLADQMQRDPKTIAAINGAFFFLVDIADQAPLDLPYNLCIRNNKILGLPSWDQPIVYIENGKIKGKDTRAIGEVTVGNKKLTWVGANSKLKKGNKYDAVLYNSKCSDVVKVREKETNIQIGILDSKNMTTKKNADYLDIVVGKDKDDNLVITHLNLGGGTNFFKGLFILQVRNSKKASHLNDKVVPLTLDETNLQTMSEGITVGKSVNDPFFSEDIRVERRDARSLIAEDIKGFIHFMAFDGSKYVPGFDGVSAKDISSFFSPDKFKWAYFLDGGGSSRIVIRKKNNKLKFLANEFAFRKLDDKTVLWDWEKARKLASSISIRIKD